MRLTRLPLAVPLAVVAAALAAPFAHAAVRDVAPAKAFRRQVQRIKQLSPLPVLLPASVAIDVPRGHGIEAKWAAYRARWSLSLGIGPRCGGANACFVGAFTAQRGAPAPSGRRVRLHGGVTGWFTPSTCGASCSPPQLQWLRADVVYGVRFRAAGPGGDRAKLVRMADSALAAGPR